MSIDSGVPDLENEAKDSDKSEEELQIEDSSRPDLKKEEILILAILNTKLILKNLTK